MQPVFVCGCSLCRRDNSGAPCYWKRSPGYDQDGWIWRRSSAAAYRAYDAKGDLHAIRYIWGSSYLRVDPCKHATNVPFLLFFVVSVVNIWYDATSFLFQNFSPTQPNQLRQAW